MEEFKFTDVEIQKLKSLCGDDVILKDGTKFKDFIKRIESVVPPKREWINLAEREPDYDKQNVVMRLLSKDMVWMSDDCQVYSEKSEVELIEPDDGCDHYWPMEVVEWLDE